jgi:hypothetical protein
VYWPLVDLEKAFDSLDSDVLSLKITKIGVREDICYIKAVNQGIKFYVIRGESQY